MLVLITIGKGDMITFINGSKGDTSIANGCRSMTVASFKVMAFMSLHPFEWTGPHWDPVLMCPGSYALPVPSSGGGVLGRVQGASPAARFGGSGCCHLWRMSRWPLAVESALRDDVRLGSKS